MPFSTKKKKKVRRQPYQERRQGGLGGRDFSWADLQNKEEAPGSLLLWLPPLGLDVLEQILSVIMGIWIVYSLLTTLFAHLIGSKPVAWVTVQQFGMWWEGSSGMTAQRGLTCSNQALGAILTQKQSSDGATALLMSWQTHPVGLA